jgi:hypothetical protein
MIEQGGNAEGNAECGMRNEGKELKAMRNVECGMRNEDQRLEEVPCETAMR